MLKSGWLESKKFRVNRSFDSEQLPSGNAAKEVSLNRK